MQINKIIWLFFGVFLIGDLSANTAPIVTNLTVGQRADGKVEINYDLEDDDNDLLAIAIEISSDGGATYDVTFSESSLIGDVGNNMITGKNKQIIWDATVDQPNVNSASYRIRLTAAEQPEDMILIPRGRFTMGDDEGSDDQKPEHVVEISPFFMDKYEVTNEQFAKFLNGNGSEFDENGNLLIDLADNDVQIAFFQGEFRSVTGLENFPVIEVTWHGANAYAKSVGKRLPTEAEWEYAARSRENRIYPWGEEISWEYANYNKHIGTTVEVIEYPAGKSRFGVLNMAGNVSEWIADLYDQNFYANSPKKDPINENAQATDRVIRGGSWYNAPDRLKCTDRYHLPADKSQFNLGFRCVLPISN